MKYRAVFTLHMKHLFYADNRCRSFQFEPTIPTQRLLKNYRCILKMLPDGILVLTAAGENDEPLIPIVGKVTFTFHLRLLNPDFSLFTELAEITSKAAPLFTNAGNNTPATPVALQLQERIASESETLILGKGETRANFRLGGHPLDGRPVTDFILQGLPGAKIGNYDTNQRELTVHAPAALADRIFTVAYPVKPRLDRGVFAEVEIHGDDSMSRPGGAASEFFIQFQPKESKWRYYLVTNRKSGQQFAIEADRQFTIFTPETSDALAKALQVQYPGLDLICFESTESVRCQEAALRQIRLKHGNEAIFESLPNPSIRSICTAPKDFAFFQVVKDIGVPAIQST
jgi:hypothetical protein